MGLIADGPLLDTLRRIAAFGTTLVRLDVRQSADRHSAVLDEITRYLGILHDGRGYAEWPETERQRFPARGTRRPQAAVSEELARVQRKL